MLKKLLRHDHINSSLEFLITCAFEYNAFVASLEDWFNPDRVREDYVPTGFRGTGKSRPVKGHPFGLKLTADEKLALIVFLKTL